MIGLFIGVGAAFFLTSLMAAQLHEVAPRDLTTFVGAYRTTGTTDSWTRSRR